MRSRNFAFTVSATIPRFEQSHPQGNTLQTQTDLVLAQVLHNLIPTFFKQPPQSYQGYDQGQYQGGYMAQQQPQTIIVQQQPQKSDDSNCCIACLAGMCCFCCADALC
ncbi:hypothetical protein DFS33DRAFT_1326837, partial [Desarmillaria ectypa]